MKKMMRGMWVGTLCLGLTVLTGCSKSGLMDSLSGSMGTMKTSASMDLFTKGIASAKKGDSTTAVSYLTAWYALQGDKVAARRQLTEQAKFHADDQTGKIIRQTINELPN